MDQDSVTSLVRFDIKFTYKIIADFCEMLKSQPAAVKSLCCHGGHVFSWSGAQRTSRLGAEIGGGRRRDGFSGENKMEPARR